MAGVPQRRRRAYVVAGEDWHEGVIGIVASRLVERYNRPVVLIAGSGRRLEGLRPLDPELRPARRRSRACAGHLERWGGHAAAAGLSIRPEEIEAFARGVRGAWPTASSPTTTSDR